MFEWEVVAFDSKGNLAVAEPDLVGPCWGNEREVGQTVVEVVLVAVEGVLRPEHRGLDLEYGGVQSLELIGLGRREWGVNDPSIYLLLPMPCCQLCTVRTDDEWAYLFSTLYTTLFLRLSHLQCRVVFI